MKISKFAGVIHLVWVKYDNDKYVFTIESNYVYIETFIYLF